MSNPWDIQHPETPVATEGAKGRSYSLQMPRGQVLEVVTDTYGRFISVRELMPPLIPSDRVPGMTREHERELREQEWVEANTRAYPSVAKWMRNIQADVVSDPIISLGRVKG